MINNIISKRNYDLLYNNDGSGEIFFGETYKKKVDCDVIKFDLWNDCQFLLTDVQIGNETKSNMDTTIVFHSEKQYVLVGSKGLMLLDAIHKLHSDKCNRDQNHYQTILKCQLDIDIDVPNIHLKINTFDLVV